MNGNRRRASARIQGSRLTKAAKTAPCGAGKRRGNVMIRKFAAALLATALIAGPAFAASATGNTGKTPAAEQTVKPAKTNTAKTNHVRKHRHYVVRHRNGGKLASVHHIKRHKRHGHYMAHVVKAPVAKPAKTEKVNKSDKS